MSSGCFRICNYDGKNSRLAASHSETGTFAYDAIVRYRDFLNAERQDYAQWFYDILPSLELFADSCASAYDHVVEIDPEMRRITVSSSILSIEDLDLHRDALKSIKILHEYAIVRQNTSTDEK
jgi:hypothetical protein